jgi:hypothetical protein
MTPRRLLVLAAVLPGAALVATSMSAPASARSFTDPCVQRGPIPVRELSMVDQLGCPLQGRLVTDGRVSVMVPPPGMTVAGEGVGRHGEARGLQISNTGTGVRVVGTGRGGGGGDGWYLAPLTTTTTGTTATTPTSTTAMTALTSTTTGVTPVLVTAPRAGDPPACEDRTFHLEHHRWLRSLRYRVNLARMPARFEKRTVIRQIRVANGNMRKGRNTCARPRLGTPAPRYLGRTSRRPDISASGTEPTCKSGNETNIVAFADLPQDLLGWTCYWYYGARMIGADMLIDNGRSLATNLPSTCSNTWDFEGTVTHEWGHAYGMAHTGPGHGNLTMQHVLKPCSTYARTLGLGDWLGMKKMYGVR